MLKCLPMEEKELFYLPENWKEDFFKLSENERKLLIDFLKGIYERDIERYYSVTLLYTPRSLLEELTPLKGNVEI
jgi:hypothetical protein